MKYRTWVWTLIPIVAVASGVVYWKKVASPPKPAREARTEIEAIRSEIETLKARSNVGHVYAAQAAERREPEYPAGEPLDSYAPGQLTPDNQHPRSEPPDTRTQEQREDDDIAANVEQAALLNNGFDDERPDPGWSIQAARQVQSALSSTLPAGSTLGKIDCRTKLCRVETTHDSIDAFKAYVDAGYISREKKTWNSGFSALVTSRTASGVNAVTFIAREGQSVPVPDSAER
jgi:hypothetical protein